MTLYLRLLQDYLDYVFTGVVRWRITPQRYTYPFNDPLLRWVIYRAGARMWTKTSLKNAVSYVREHL